MSASGAADHAKALQALLQQQVHLRNMARIPIILELICSSFIEQKNWVYGSDMGLTNVYRAIITSLLKRYLLRQGEAIEELSSKAVWEHPRCQLLLQALAAIAWQGMQQHDLIIGPKGYFFVLKQMRIDQDAEMLQEIFAFWYITTCERLPRIITKSRILFFASFYPRVFCNLLRELFKSTVRINQI
ncbi:MAG: hypothetical protein HWD59_04450 [Coxiellaceae bacterium]|nr:MAG: hypothetical protein HWD59_04450 [Coxiellaceae bacterium]